MSTDPPCLDLIIGEVNDAIRRAYAEGYRKGSLEAVDKMQSAVGLSLGLPLAELGKSVALNKEVPKVHPVAAGDSNFRQAPYGRVITAMRQALVASDTIGISKEQLIQFGYRLGVDIGPNQFKDTMKRLVGGDEALRRGVNYYPGPRLRRDLVPTDFQEVSQNTEADESESVAGSSSASATSGNLF